MIWVWLIQNNSLLNHPEVLWGIVEVHLGIPFGTIGNTVVCGSIGREALPNRMPYACTWAAKSTWERGWSETLLMVVLVCSLRLWYSQGDRANPNLYPIWTHFPISNPPPTINSVTWACWQWLPPRRGHYVTSNIHENCSWDSMVASVVSILAIHKW